MKKEADTDRPRPNDAALPPYSRDFLCRAYRYRQRPRRSPREDFLTEVFGELLNTLSIIECGRYVVDLLGIGRMVGLCSGLRWSTQRTIPDAGRPDLIGQGTSVQGGDVYIVVENKVGAGYTETEAGDQLSRYRAYLNQRKEPHKALVLITHWTTPTAQVDSVVRWREISGKLKQWKKEGGLANFPVAEALADWLVCFLKEENMSEIKLDLMDIASVSTHRCLIDACAALEEVINPVADSLNGKFKDVVGLKVPSGWGEFSSNNLGAPFFGGIWTADGKKCRDSGAILWVGLWTGVDIYNIQPTLPDVPELSAGIALWPEEDVDRVKELLSDTKLTEAGWKLDSIAKTDDYFEAMFLRKARPLSVCYQPGLDWGDEVKSFSEQCCDDLRAVDTEALRAIVQWDAEEEGGAAKDEDDD